MTKYIMIDVGSPCDSISLRTLVETLKHHEVEVHDMLTGDIYSLAMWAKEVEDVQRERGGGAVQDLSDGVPQSAA